MRGGGRSTPLALTRGPQLLLLSLTLLCLAVSGDGGASAAGGGSRSARMTQEALLRAAMARKTKTVLRLTGDVHLTRDLGTMTCPDLTVIGSCKTGSGRPRRCTIDGRKRFSGISGYSPNLTLDNLELTGFVGTSTRPVFIVGCCFPMVTISNCLVTGNAAGTYVNSLFSLVALKALAIKNSQFVRNKGRIFSLAYTDLTATNVLFRSNEGGPLIDLFRASVECDACRFEGNKAAERAAVVVADDGFVLFSRSSFVGNSLTRVGARGGAVHVASSPERGASFCNCVFRGNTIALPGGKNMTEHVYINPITSTYASVSFCKKRPAIGINGNISLAVDSCEGCPA